MSDEPRQPRGKQKRHLAPFDPTDKEAMASHQAAIADLGHLYDRPAQLVIRCRSLSATAKAVYWFLDSMCAAVNSTTPERCEVIVGLAEIADLFAVSEDFVSACIKELRQHGFVYRHPRQQRLAGYLQNRYELPLRRMRLDYEREMRNRRQRNLENL